MASQISDRWLWLGVGIFFLAAAQGIKYALTDMVRLTELDEDHYPSNDHEEHKQPEDSIPVETLLTLYRSPNPSISAAAQSLIVTRFASLPNAAEILTQDSYSENDEIRRKARQAVQFLHEWDLEVREDAINPRATMDAWDAFAEEHNSDRAESIDLMDSGVVARLDELAGNQARFAGWDSFLRERPDIDEAERRRRRREAVVLHEGDGPFVEGDIIRPRGR